MKVIEQLVNHLRSEGALDDAQVAWLRRRGFLASLEELEYDPEDYDDEWYEHSYESDAEVREHELIEDLQQDRAKRRRAREVPKSSKGARRARVLRNLVHAQGTQKRKSRKIKNEHARLKRLRSPNSAVPALVAALHDPRASVVTAALEVLALVGIPQDEEIVGLIRQLRNNEKNSIAIAATLAESHLFPQGSKEAFQLVRKAIIACDGKPTRLKTRLFVGLRQHGLWITDVTAQLLETPQALSAETRLLCACLQFGQIEESLPAAYRNAHFTYLHSFAEKTLVESIIRCFFHVDSPDLSGVSEVFGLSWKIEPARKGYALRGHAIQFNFDSTGVFQASKLASSSHHFLNHDDFLSLKRGWYWVDSSSLTPGFARRLRLASADTLVFSRLKSFAWTAASRELARFPGTLYLDEFPVLREDTAQELANHRGPVLSLMGVEEMSTTAARHLGKYEGHLALNFDALSEEIVAILGRGESKF